MASALYENVGEWHTNVESRDMFSSDETQPSDFKEGAKDHDDEYEEVSPKRNSLKETPEITSFVKTETAKENGQDHHAIIGNAINGNGVHEIQVDDPLNYDGQDDEGNEIHDGQVNGEENYNDREAAETNEADRTPPPVQYYGRTLVAPEYMNFQLEETSQNEEKTAEDDNDNRITVADKSSDDLGSPRTEEETPYQTLQKEVLEEEDITLSEEESDIDEDEDGNVEEEDQSVRVDCQVEEQPEEEEEEEEEEDEEDEEKEEEKTAGENPEVYRVGSPQLAQAEDDEEDEEGNEYDEVHEGSSLKKGEVEEQVITEEDGQQATQSKSSVQLAETDDDEEHDEEIEIETTNESCNLKQSDSLKLQVTSPTLDIGEVGSVAESFDDHDGKGVTTEDNRDDGDKLSDRDGQEYIIEDGSFNETDDQHEERRKTFNGPVQEFESQGNKHVEEEERDDYSCQSDDAEEDSNDETSASVESKDNHTCDDESSADLDTIPEGLDVEAKSEAQAEEYSELLPEVYISSQGQSDESDLAGRVKELGRMFEGGGPVFPKTVKNDTDAVDGSPVSVRRYRAIFEQDQLSAERAREPGRREELTGPPRGLVKNLRGLFENPQGFEARKG